MSGFSSGNPGAASDRTDDVAKDLLARRPAFVPEWLPSAGGVDPAMTRIVARFIQTIEQRLDQAPAKHGLAFLDLLGIRLIPARAARAPIVFTLANTTQDARIPAGTRVAAPPPPGSNDQVIFETEQTTGIAVAKLEKVVSVWPGRDQYIDHSAAALALTPFRPFDLADLAAAPHALCLAHDTLLGLAGTSALDISFELTSPGSERLEVTWEYWDGKLWREFSNLQLDCADDIVASADGTAGFTRSGTVHLESDGGKAEKRTVNGLESYWVRARLAQPLPPDPARILPEVDRIGITSQIARPLIFAWTSKLAPLRGAWGSLVVNVTDDVGGPLGGLAISTGLFGDAATGADGKYEFEEWSEDAIAVSVGGFRAERVVPEASAGQELTFSLTARGLNPDKAVADGLPVDVSKPFFPFGPQPQPGSAFYFTSEEAFSKPGARLRVYIQTTETTQDQIVAASTAANTAANTPAPIVMAHTVSWEYWNGEGWKSLSWYSAAAGSTTGSPDDFTATGLIASDLIVPTDMEPRRVGNQDGRWMRVRLASGTYAVQQSVPLQNGSEFVFSLPRPPSVAKILLGYTWPQGPYPPERVFAHNDFVYLDRTEASTWPGETFQPFVTVVGTPAVYLGFDKVLPVDRLGLLFDIEEVRGEERGPALQWSYWDGIAWQPVVADDETEHLRQPGIVTLIGPADSAPLSRFEASLYWLRAALKHDGPPGAPTVRAIHLNAVWAAQHMTVSDEPLGASSGQPDQVIAFRQRPILPGQLIAVRELEGMRANVEWRIVVREVFAGEPGAIERFEAMLATEGTRTDLEWQGVRLVRDRNKRVREVWVQWAEQPHLFYAGPNDRVYVMDPARGRALFGDGFLGKIPPLGAALIARRYRTGGGAAGNLPAKAISQLLAPVGGMESVFNALPAEGGSDGERADTLAQRGPRTIHHRGRAVGAADYAAQAVEASSAIGRAWVLPATEPDGLPGAGWVTLVVIPKTTDPRPWPSFGLRQEVQRYVEASGPAGVAGRGHVIVTGPGYRAIGIDATLVPLDVSEAGVVEQRVLAALSDFLHPLRGGGGSGWEPGQPVYRSDVASVIEACPGVDYVRELSVLMDATPQGDRADVGPGRVVAAGEMRLRLVED